uniref:Uncharacterized protein n=1 Tax=Anguilla anguilla TaxID=7936 RepID=A0A0E9WA68_ANGAN
MSIQSIGSSWPYVSRQHDLLVTYFNFQTTASERTFGSQLTRLLCGLGCTAVDWL